MTLRDVSNGPDWILWVVFAVLTIMSIVLLTGHGAGMIAGYNTATKEEKRKYNEKKLCRVIGIGLSAICILILVSAIGMDILPAYFAYIMLTVIVADVVVMLVLMNTICKR